MLLNFPVQSPCLPLCISLGRLLKFCPALSPMGET